MPKSNFKKRQRRTTAASFTSNKSKQAFARVETISRNASGLWFGLLAALVFSGITLLRIEDIDFFGVDRTNQLPLIGVSVPVTAFFYAGGALTTVIYVYFHLYLVQLYEALGETAPTHKGQPLSKAVYPWMITDTLIRWRSQLRGDKSAADRNMAGLSILASVVAVWLFGLVVIGFFWLRSMPAHNEVLTLWLGALLTLAIAVSLTAAFATHKYLAGNQQSHPFWKRFQQGAIAFLSVFIACFGFLRTEGFMTDRLLVEANLFEARLVKISK